MNTRFKDAMTPKERMVAFSSGQEIDRIPCMPQISDYDCRLIGVPVSSYNRSAEIMAAAQIKSFNTYRHDSVEVGPGLLGIAEAMGTKLAYPNDGIPFVAEPVLKDWQDFSGLTPANPYRDGRLPLFLEALQIINDAIGDEVVLGSSVGGPFTAAASIRGTENFLKDLYKNREKAHLLLELVTESALLYIDAVCDLGIMPGLSEPTASPALISTQQFREFALPYLKIYADRIRQRCGSGPTLHICGNSRPIWLEMVEVGADTLSLDNVIDMEEAKKEVGHQVCLSGNVKPIDTLMRGNRQDIYAESQECLRKAHDNPKGFILSSGCSIALDTPPENILAFMDAARIYGKYPIEPEKWK